MTATTPVERIVEHLVGAGFRRLETPIAIAGVTFDFPAALIGSASMPDLIVVADTVLDKEERIKSKIEGIARALDVVRSKRPLTLVLAGPRPRTAIMDDMSKVCRVLTIGTPAVADEKAALDNWLAVLMPLQLPQTTDAIADPMNELKARFENADDVTAQLLAAAPSGAAQVSDVLYRLIAEPLAEIESEQQ